MGFLLLLFNVYLQALQAGKCYGEEYEMSSTNIARMTYAHKLYQKRYGSRNISSPKRCIDGTSVTRFTHNLFFKLLIYQNYNLVNISKEYSKEASKSNLTKAR